MRADGQQAASHAEVDVHDEEERPSGQRLVVPEFGHGLWGGMDVDQTFYPQT